jgi:hypothetical protein
VLHKLAGKGLIKQKKTSTGFSAGVKTYWMPEKGKTGMLKETRSKMQSMYLKRLVADIDG